MVAYIEATMPIKRLGTCEDVANAVLFLASDEASYINGVKLLVDGAVTKMHAVSALTSS